MLATTRATEELWGHGKLTPEDFRMVSVDPLRKMKKMVEYNDLVILLRIGYLNRLRDDPSGEDLKLRLFEEIESDASMRIDDDSSLGHSLKISAYEYVIYEPQFKRSLLGRIGDIDKLRISEEQAGIIKAGWLTFDLRSIKSHE